MSNTTLQKTREQEIIDSAVKLFAKSGFHNTPVQAIADAAGLNKATLYYYIHSKENLLFLMHRDIIDHFLADLEAICSESGLTATERLRRTIRTHIRHVTERQAEVKIFFREKDSASPKVRNRIAERRQRYQDLVVSIIDQGIKSGEFREADAKLMAFFIIGMCNWLYQWYSPEGPLSSDEISRAAIEFVLSGLSNER